MKFVEKFKSLTKEEKIDYLVKHFFVVIGSFLLAMGTALFITNLQIVSGGLSGIAIIIQAFFPGVQVVDICIAIGTFIFWVVGVFVIGKKFIIRTTFASICYSAFIFMFMRDGRFQYWAFLISKEGDIGNILVCAIFYGVFSGAGVALTFLGEGSTGGVDVLIYLLSKKTKLKQSVWSFIIDAFIVGASILIIPDNVLNSLCGIIAAFVAALMIEYVYVGNQTSYCVDVISQNYEEISKYAQDVLGRGATLIPVFGGYKKEERIMLRIVIEKRQYDRLRRFISKTDKKAFVTYTPTISVYGEGFTKH